MKLPGSQFLYLSIYTLHACILFSETQQYIHTYADKGGRHCSLYWYGVDYSIFFIPFASFNEILFVFQVSLTQPPILWKKIKRQALISTHNSQNNTNDFLLFFILE